MRKKATSTILIIVLSLSVILAQNSRSTSKSNAEMPEFSSETLKLDEGIELYPNPTSDFLNVTVKKQDLEKVEFEMYNIIGNSLNIEIEEVSSHSYKINVKDFNPGYYLLVVKDPFSRFNQVVKFQKQ
jgi:hypothetical protein